MLRILKWLLIFTLFIVVGGFALTVLGIFALIGMAVFGSEQLGDLTIKTDRAVGVVELTGEILSSEEFRKNLNRMLSNDKIKAIVTRIDSPGGAVGASEEIFRAIERADEKKPVVCSLGNLAASGGLYAAVGCRKIFTNKGTLTGSIGVLFMTPNVTELIDKFGVKMRVIKSGKFKDSGSPFRPSTPEEEELLQSLVETSYEQFLSAIAEGRSLDKEKVRTFADGRIILGEQAVAWGLADEFGGIEEAAKEALVLSGDTSGEAAELILIPKNKGLRALLTEMQGRITQLKDAWTKPSLWYRVAW